MLEFSWNRFGGWKIDASPNFNLSSDVLRNICRRRLACIKRLNSLVLLKIFQAFKCFDWSWESVLRLLVLCLVFGIARLIVSGIFLQMSSAAFCGSGGTKKLDQSEVRRFSGMSSQRVDIEKETLWSIHTSREVSSQGRQSLVTILCSLTGKGFNTETLTLGLVCTKLGVKYYEVLCLWPRAKPIV